MPKKEQMNCISKQEWIGQPPAVSSVEILRWAPHARDCCNIIMLGRAGAGLNCPCSKSNAAVRSQNSNFGCSMSQCCLYVQSDLARFPMWDPCGTGMHKNARAPSTATSFTKKCQTLTALANWDCYVVVFFVRCQQTAPGGVQMFQHSRFCTSSRSLGPNFFRLFNMFNTLLKTRCSSFNKYDRIQNGHFPHLRLLRLLPSHPLHIAHDALPSPTKCLN